MPTRVIASNAPFAGQRPSASRLTQAFTSVKYAKPIKTMPGGIK